MPAGRDHNSINAWVATAVCAVGLALGADLGLIIALLAGLLLGTHYFTPDLDQTNSDPIDNWGPLKPLWLPYAWAIKHRAPASHGLILGTPIRILYFFAMSGVTGLILTSLYRLVTQEEIAPGEQIILAIEQLSRLYLKLSPTQWLGLLAGLWIGGISHSVADYVSTWWKSGRKPQRRK